MERLFKIPFAFLLVGGGLGLLLRWHFVSPMPWLNYPNWLHAHSHIMFLGWIGNFLMLAYLINYSLWKKRRYRILFYFIQLLLLGMLISFPLQGYGLVSIIFSTIHILAWWTFIIWYFIDLKHIDNSISIWYSKISLLLFVIASLGPFTLGPLMVNGLGHSKWYYFAIYYYLHFQYNGFFIFGVLSLWFHLLENKVITFNYTLAITSGRLLSISLFPSYVLSILWSNPGILYNSIGFIGAMIQLTAFVFFLLLMKGLQLQHTSILWKLSLLSFAVKIILQLFSSHPLIAQLALEVRPFVIAYLHLVVIGTVSLSLIAFSLEKQIITIKSLLPISLIIAGFFGSELIMILMGIPSSRDTNHAYSIILFLLSLTLLSGFCILFFRVKRKISSAII